MPGRIPHERIRSVYALMDVMVYPRRSIRLTELVTPLKPLEAMAMGKAVIASDIGGHRELVTHNETGILFPAGDATALSRAIVSVLGDRELLERLGKAGIKYVIENKTWRETTSVYKKIYSRLPGNRRWNGGIEGNGMMECGMGSGREWNDGMVEGWNDGAGPTDKKIRFFSHGKIRLSPAFNPQHSNIPLFHHSSGLTSIPIFQYSNIPTFHVFRDDFVTSIKTAEKKKNCKDDHVHLLIQTAERSDLIIRRSTLDVRCSTFIF